MRTEVQRHRVPQSIRTPTRIANEGEDSTPLFDRNPLVGPELSYVMDSRGRYRKSQVVI